MLSRKLIISIYNRLKQNRADLGSLCIEIAKQTGQVPCLFLYAVKLSDCRDGYAEADEIVGFIVDEICSPLPYTTLRGQAFPRAVIQPKKLKANIYMVENVLENTAKVDNIKDFHRYFISSLYNEVLTYHFNEGSFG